LFLRSFNRNADNANPKAALGFTLILGCVIFGYFYFYGKINTNRYPFFKAKENLVLIIERSSPSGQDTVSWLYRRINLWRYYGTNLGLYEESSDSLLAEFRYSHQNLQAVYQQIPFYNQFDQSGQQYGISLMVPDLSDSSRWSDPHLGFRHKVLNRDTLLFQDKKVDCLLIESRMTYQAAETIIQRLSARKDTLSCKKLNKLRFQSWLNWYSKDYGWLQTVYPDGRKLRVIEIKEIYWFQRISRYFDYGVYEGRKNF